MTFPLWIFAPPSRGDGDNDRHIRALGVVRAEVAASAAQSESAVVARLRDGDETALRVIMEQYFDAVAEVAWHYVRNTDTARDIAQDVFIRVWHRRGTLDPAAPIVHYLRRAARNAALDTLDRERAAGKMASALVTARDDRALYDENFGAQAVDLGDIQTVVQRTLETLSPRVREVARLYIEGGLEPGEIAALLHVAPRTVYNQLRSAMQVLARALEGWKS